MPPKTDAKKSAKPKTSGDKEKSGKKPDATKESAPAKKKPPQKKPEAEAKPKTAKPAKDSKAAKPKDTKPAKPQPKKDTKGAKTGKAKQGSNKKKSVKPAKVVVSKTSGGKRKERRPLRPLEYSFEKGAVPFKYGKLTDAEKAKLLAKCSNRPGAVAKMLAVAIFPLLNQYRPAIGKFGRKTKKSYRCVKLMTRGHLLALKSKGKGAKLTDEQRISLMYHISIVRRAIKRYINHVDSLKPKKKSKKGKKRKETSC